MRGPITRLGPDGKVPKELHDLLTPATVSLAGANIIMQLAQLPVGRGVAESKVDSGNLYKHPIKRGRTTFGYVMVAVFGSDEERDALAAAVTEVHRQVRSAPGDAVRYTALDPQLQLWVAACIYRGIEDGYALVHGPPRPELLDLIYRHGARLATMLQVPAAMWPPDRAAFEAYWARRKPASRWTRSHGTISMTLPRLGFLPWPVPKAFGLVPSRRYGRISRGAFRRRARTGVGTPRAASLCPQQLPPPPRQRVTPRRLRTLPFDVHLWDMRRRIRSGRAIV